MADLPPTERLDRHGLVMAIWTPALLVSAILLHKGFVSGGGWWVFAGFAAIIAAFVAHIIANAMLGTEFTQGETALGSVVFAIALLCLLLSRIAYPELFRANGFLHFGLGLASLIVSVIAYMVIAFGARGAFGKYDIIRDNNPRPSSRLAHRGGRR